MLTKFRIVQNVCVAGAHSDAPTVYGAVVRAPYKGTHRANFTRRRAHVRGSPKGSLRAFGGSEQSDAPTVYSAVVRPPYKGMLRANFTRRRAILYAFPWGANEEALPGADEATE